jgi:hypothetical protein
MLCPIVNHTKRGELVYEPFLGSRTTLVATELPERVCCGMEPDSKDVDVSASGGNGCPARKATIDDIAVERRAS